MSHRRLTLDLSRSLSSISTAFKLMVHLVLLWAFLFELTGLEGIGAADITKLKANGFYTVAVTHPFCFFYAVVVFLHEFTLSSRFTVPPGRRFLR